ncbi:MAG: SDR family NAD(P)-dependent oxidoreductase [Flavobacteriia bacterium]|nr:SDR family NAD(P)-dependent oxidoreductase [Flavobacteriia bacterium]
MSKILIISGGNKGIGKGLTTIYLEKGYIVYSFSRSINSEFVHDNLVQFKVDVSNIDELEVNILDVFSTIDLNQNEEITLINNAGTLGCVNQLTQISVEDIQNTLNTNLLGPIIITKLFLNYFNSQKKKIINVSSGAASKEFYGWSVYGTTKAGLDFFSKSIAFEYPEVKVLNIYPGVVDTDMQQEIRSKSTLEFKLVDQFIDYKKKNVLNDIYVVGKKIFELSDEGAFYSGEIIRIKDNRE